MPIERDIAFALAAAACLVSCSNHPGTVQNTYNEVFDDCVYLPATAVQIAGGAATPQGCAGTIESVGSGSTSAGAGVIDVTVFFEGTATNFDLSFPANTGSSTNPTALTLTTPPGGDAESTTPAPGQAFFSVSTGTSSASTQFYTGTLGVFATTAAPTQPDDPDEPTSFILDFSRANPPSGSPAASGVISVGSVTCIGDCPTGSGGDAGGASEAGSSGNGECESWPATLTTSNECSVNSPSDPMPISCGTNGEGQECCCSAGDVCAQPASGAAECDGYCYLRQGDKYGVSCGPSLAGNPDYCPSSYTCVPLVGTRETDDSYNCCPPGATCTGAPNVHACP